MVSRTNRKEGGGDVVGKGDKMGNQAHRRTGVQAGLKT